MSDDVDRDRFVKDPGLLVELCREVIDELDSGVYDSDVGTRETQLREIAKTIERLERASVAVPMSCAPKRRGWRRRWPFMPILRRRWRSLPMSSPTS